MKKTVIIFAMILISGCGVDVKGLLDEADIKQTSGKYSDAIELYTKVLKTSSSKYSL